MDTTSLWEAISQRKKEHPPLTKDIDVEVAIIGGGITGITAANELIQAGKKVVILEAERIGGVTTGFSTGNLYIALQAFYQTIAEKFDFETAKAIALSRQFAIDYIEKNVTEKDISCDFFRRPWYAYTARTARVSIEKEAQLLEQMGIPVETVKHLPLPFRFKKAILMSNQARFNPLQYVISMADNLAKQGCLIYENTRVIDLIEKDHCLLKTDRANIRAQKVFMATHTPLGVNKTQLYTAPYRSYVVSAKLKNKEYPEGHFWDLDRPPHATCTHALSSTKPKLLMVAGSHHKTGQGKAMSAHYKELEGFLQSHFDIDEFSYRWSAQHFQSADHVPYIGLASAGSKHTYMATGYWADGLIYGTLAGIIISDMILDKQSAFAKAYDARRHKPLASAAFIFKENANVLWQYLQDFPLLPPKNLASIKKGEGKVVEIDQEKIAVYRDEANQLHQVSAVCTHMKGIVAWNNAEKTWDCPCHGSRFTISGEVIEGPAMTCLKKITSDLTKKNK